MAWFVVGSIVVAMAAGCSDSGSGGGSGGTAGGGGSGDGDCVDDGACRSNEGERCTCRDCWPRDACEFRACVNDGLCRQSENCACSDCSATPECESYCVPCSEFVRQLTPRPPFVAAFPPKSALCDPESVALYDAFEQCVCEDSCVEACENSLCDEATPSIACINCYAVSCAAELQACGQAVRPDVLCNPVTGEPCREGEACDRIQPFPGTISGFFCFPPPNDVGLCETCNEASGAFCGNTLTCVDETGGFSGGAGACARYCCTDEDCGAGSCVAGNYAPAAPDLGVCSDSAGGIPGCEIAEPPPSGGSCAQP
jgi:hypothetical protein